MNQNVRCLNGFTLKMIAIVTMLIDHIGAILYPQQMIFRWIGRIAFPIFLFLLTEGFLHTKNLRRYELRLFLFALISEIPFDLAFSGVFFDWENQNVFFTLGIGMVMMDLLRRLDKKIFCQILIIALCMAAAALLHTDYGAGGILLVFLFYRFRERPAVLIPLTGLTALIFYLPIELFCLVAFLPILLYNGKKGPSLKYAFYAFYPVHLTILALIALSAYGAYFF